MNNFTFSEETDWSNDIRVADKPEDVVVCCARFLFCGEILMEICDGISLRLEDRSGPRHTTCGLRPERQCVIHIVGAKS